MSICKTITETSACSFLRTLKYHKKLNKYTQVSYHQRRAARVLPYLYSALGELQAGG